MSSWYLPGNTPGNAPQAPSVSFDGANDAFALPDNVPSVAMTSASSGAAGSTMYVPSRTGGRAHYPDARARARGASRSTFVHEHHPNRRSPEARRGAAARVAALAAEVSALRVAHARRSAQVRQLRARPAAPEHVVALQAEVATLRAEQARRAFAHYNPWAP